MVEPLPRRLHDRLNTSSSKKSANVNSVVVASKTSPYVVSADEVVNTTRTLRSASHKSVFYKLNFDSVLPVNKLAEIEEDSSPVDITAASSEEDRPSTEVFHRKPIIESFNCPCELLCQ